MPEGSAPHWRLWVDHERRIVSLHPKEGSQAMEFYDRELFLHCIDEYARRRYRYQ